MFDKALLSMGGSIGSLFLLVNGYYASKSRGWRCGWVRTSGSAAALLRNQLIRRDRLQASESAWPTLKGTSNFSCMPFRFPVAQGCRGQHHLCLPSAVFPARRYRPALSSPQALALFSSRDFFAGRPGWP